LEKERTQTAKKGRYVDTIEKFYILKKLRTITKLMTRIPSNQTPYLKLYSAPIPANELASSNFAWTPIHAVTSQQ
jgi:hypothetical protein